MVPRLSAHDERWSNSSPTGDRLVTTSWHFGWIISPDRTRRSSWPRASHAVGVGPLLPVAVVRAMLLVRANTLALGYSGVRPVIVQRLLEMLNCGVHPVVPAQGSLGASGDLAPLAHLALVLIGEGEAEYEGERLTGAEAMRRAGLEPVTLEAKRGWLVNGTTLMVGYAAARAPGHQPDPHADIAAAMSLEALNGTDCAYDARVRIRPHPVD